MSNNKSIQLSPNVIVAAHVCSVCGKNNLSLVVHEVAVCIDCFNSGVIRWNEARLQEAEDMEKEIERIRERWRI